MKITIENTWPEIGDKAEERKTISYDTHAWDDDLDTVIEALVSLLIAYGFSAKHVQERLGQI